MPEKFTSSFALELNENSKIPVHEVRHNMTLEKGNAYVFPGGTHGRISAFGLIYVYYNDRNHYDAHPFKPSVDVAINHLMSGFHGHVIGAILSGMGSDGAYGMTKLKEKGSLIIAQDEKSSTVWGMPGATVKQNGADILLSYDEIGTGIVRALEFYGLNP